MDFRPGFVYKRVPYVTGWPETAFDPERDKIGFCSSYADVYDHYMKYPDKKVILVIDIYRGRAAVINNLPEAMDFFYCAKRE